MTTGTEKKFCRLSPTRRRLRADRRGAIIIMFAVMLPIIVGFVGIGVEIAFWFTQDRDVQSIADMAAVGGAYDKRNGGNSASITTAATSEATRNGYSAASGYTINVEHPPTAAGYTANNDAVEVTITRTIQSLFAGTILGKGKTVTVNATAIAEVQSGGDACVLSLDTSGAGVTVSGNGNVTFDGCQVASNSSDAGALTVSGSGDLITDCYSVVGSVSDNGGLATDAGCSGVTGGPAISDPYAGLTAPASGTCDSGGYTHNSTSTVSIAGSYANPYFICGTLWVKKGTVALDPGIYVIDGGDLNVSSQGTLTGTGVTIILKNGGQINKINGGGVELTAPTSAAAGQYVGILIFQDPATTTDCTGNNCNQINGNSTSFLEGVVYFPDQEIYMNGGNVSTAQCLQVVAKRVSFSGNNDMLSDNTQCGAIGVDPIEIPGVVRLVQ